MIKAGGIASQHTDWNFWSSYLLNLYDLSQICNLAKTGFRNAISNI